MNVRKINKLLEDAMDDKQNSRSYVVSKSLTNQDEGNESIVDLAKKGITEDYIDEIISKLNNKLSDGEVTEVYWPYYSRGYVRIRIDMHIPLFDHLEPRDEYFALERKFKIINQQYEVTFDILVAMHKPTAHIYIKNIISDQDIEDIIKAISGFQHGYEELFFSKDTEKNSKNENYSTELEYDKIAGELKEQGVADIEYVKNKGDALVAYPIDNYFIIDDDTSEEQYDELMEMLKDYQKGIHEDNFKFSVDYDDKSYDELQNSDVVMKYYYVINVYNKLTIEDYARLEHLINMFNEEVAIILNYDYYA